MCCAMISPLMWCLHSCASIKRNIGGPSCPRLLKKAGLNKIIGCPLAGSNADWPVGILGFGNAGIPHGVATWAVDGPCIAQNTRAATKKTRADFITYTSCLFDSVQTQLLPKEHPKSQ